MSVEKTKWVLVCARVCDGREARTRGYLRTNHQFRVHLCNTSLLHERERIGFSISDAH